MAEPLMTEQQGLKMEYEVLRQEVLRRIEMRSQIALATLTFAGVTLGVGLSTPAVALIFPVIGLFLAIGWIQHDARVREITTYIRDNIEGKIAGLGWEAHRQRRVHKSTRLGGARLSVLSAAGLFLVCQSMAIVIGLSKAPAFTLLEWGLAALSGVVILLTLVLFNRARRGSRA